MTNLTSQLSEQNNAIPPENTDMLIANVIETVKSYSKNANTDMIEVAYRLAKKAHENQFRKSGDAYIVHPVA